MNIYLKNKFKFFVDNNSSILSRNLIYETNNSVNFIQCIISIFKEVAFANCNLYFGVYIQTITVYFNSFFFDYRCSNFLFVHFQGFEKKFNSQN